MIYLYDINLKLIDEISKDDIIELTETQELNGQINAITSYQYIIHKEDAMYYGYETNETFYIFRIINKSKSKGVITLTGIHIFFDELKGVVIRDKRPSNVTAYNAMTVALEGTKWTVESSVTGIDSINFYYTTSLKAFYDVIEKWKCEFKLKIQVNSGGIESRKVIIADTIAKDNGKWFEYGDKLLTVVAEEGLGDIYTSFVGRGKGKQTQNGGFGRKIDFSSVEWNIQDGKPLNKPLGQDYLEFPNATTKYGYPGGKPKTVTVDFDDIEDPQKLLEATYHYGLNASRPKLQLKATAISDDRVEVGEIAAIVRPDLEIRYKTRVFKVKTNRLKNTQEFEFGDKIKQSTSDRIKTDIKNTEKIKEDIESVKSKIIAQVTNYYFNEDGYNYELKVGNEYNLPAGYYSFNKSIDQEPTKLVYMGAGKVLISNKKGTDGAWIWQTAITAEGVVGDSIITQSITVNQLASDVGQSLDISSNEAIIATVKKDNYDSDIEIINNNYTSLKQSTEEFEFKFVTQNDFDDEQKVNNERQETLEKYIRFIDGKIVLGEEGNELELKLENKKIVFLDKGKEVAYFTNNQLFVDDIQVVTRMQIAQSEFRMITDNIAGIGVIK